MSKILGVAVILVFLALGIGCSVYRYRECRTQFSTFYCLREFSR